MTHPISLAMFCQNGRLVLFDSHSHGSGGALQANTPEEDVLAFIREFFTMHRSIIKFTNDSAAIAHIPFSVCFLSLASMLSLFFISCLPATILLNIMFVTHCHCFSPFLQKFSFCIQVVLTNSTK